jgi:putative Ca2+/H+ antiporter (TMEM165/GDT1 family)
MKKVAFLFIALCLNLLVFGQKSLSASAKNSTELKGGVASGHIQLILPSEVTAENVTMYAKYYTNMFTVEFDEKSHLATFHMITNDTFSRRVILRFLSANQIVSVQVENKNYDLGTFFENYLQ